MKHYIFGVAFATYLVTLDAQRLGRMFSPEPYSATALAGVAENYIDQILDHDDPSSETWQQRYFVNTDYWHRDSSSVVFLKLFGEETATPGWLSGGDVYVWGIRYGALMFSLEHRFFGASQPTTDTSDENIKYLTSQQALGDIAEFISQMTTEYDLSSDTKWIVSGCSYAGSLAAWSRLKYPDTIYGAVASSSPLEARADFKEFNEVLRQSLETSYPGCGTAITNATKTIQTMLDSNSGIKSLQKKFSFCGGFNPGRPNDRAELFHDMTAYTAIAVQYNEQHPAPSDIASVCKYMLDTSIPQPVDRFAKLRAVQGDGNCVTGSFKSTVAYEKGSSWDDPGSKSGARQWTYMTCNEFGFFLTSSASNSFFGNTIPLSYFVNKCTSVFGSDFNLDQLNEAVARTNENYKGTNIDVSRLVVVEGSLDPWYPLGILKNPTEDTQQVFIQGGSHCQNVLTPQSTEPQSMKNGRAVIQAALDKWILYSK